MMSTTQRRTATAGVQCVGFIGLGDMGRPIARRLLRAGIPLVVCDKNPEAVELFRKEGAIVAATPAETASLAQLVLACLPAPSISKDVAFGAEGVIHGTAIQWYAEVSTIGYSTMRTISQALTEKGIGVLDAPVSGGPRGEARGRLSCFVAASQGDFDAARDVLTAMSDRLFHVGETPGQSQVLKLANNLLGAANLTIASEMVLMAKRAGIDPATAIEVINVSTGRNRATEEIFESQILNQSFGLGARLNILQKDVGLAVDEAERLGVSHTAASGVRQVWDQAVQEGHGSEDLSKIYSFIEQLGLNDSKGTS